MFKTVQEKMSSWWGGSFINKTWKRVDNKIIEIGTNEDGKGNMLGHLWAAFKGLVALPITLVIGTYKFLKLLVTSPEDAVELIKFNFYRMGVSAGALMGVYLDPATRTWDVTRGIIMFYVWLISSIFASPLIEAGYVTAGLCFVFVPVVIWILSGIGLCVETWKYVTAEEYKAQAENTRKRQALKSHRRKEKLVKDAEKLDIGLEKAEADAADTNRQLEDAANNRTRMGYENASKRIDAPQGQKGIRAEVITPPSVDPMTKLDSMLAEGDIPGAMNWIRFCESAQIASKNTLSAMRAKLVLGSTGYGV